MVDHDTGLQFAAIVVIAIAATLEVVRRRHLTAGTALLLLFVLWALPSTVGRLAIEARTDVPTFWATPVQVDVALTALGVLVLLSPLGRRVSTRAQLRVLLIPALLIYSAVFLSEEWESWLAKPLLLAAIVWVLVARAPDVVADPRRQTWMLCTFLGAQLATLVVYYLAFMYPGFDEYTSSSALYSWLWFAVPLSAILTARMTAYAPDPALGAATGKESVERAQVAVARPDSSAPQ
jgi:hypothetical protein